MFIRFPYIFPIHGGSPRDDHYYVFLIDFKNKQKQFLNSLDVRKSYESSPVYHQTFRNLMEYVGPFLRGMKAKDMSQFTWRVFDAPSHADNRSCSLFVIYFTDHYNGGFTLKITGQWNQRTVLEVDRAHYAYRITSDIKTCEKLPQKVS